MSVTIYHNPRCSKSREALKLIQEKGVEPTIVEYLKTPPDRQTLQEVIRQLGITPRELLRENEEEYKQAGLDDLTLSDDDVIAAMIEHPKLIERPIVIHDGKAIIGRPPVKALDILPEN
jgi:arsenate reductase